MQVEGAMQPSQHTGWPINGRSSAASSTDSLDSILAQVRSQSDALRKPR